MTGEELLALLNSTTEEQLRMQVVMTSAGIKHPGIVTMQEEAVTDRSQFGGWFEVGDKVLVLK